jgi:hypothetical protein
MGSFAMGPIPRNWLRLGWAVATSVSEWKLFHSLTLVATSERKRTGGEINIDVVWLIVPELAPGIFTDVSGKFPGGTPVPRLPAAVGGMGIPPTFRKARYAGWGARSLLADHGSLRSCVGLACSQAHP